MAKKTIIKTKKRRRITESRGEFVKRMQEDYPQVGVDSAEDFGWRSLSAAANRDLNPLTQKRMQEIAHYLYDSNPLAHRILEITKDFVVGDGFQFKARDEKVQEILDDFWYDPDNNWEVKQDTKVLELGLWGEQCYPVFVNKYNGHVKLGYLDPGLITKVRLDKNNPERIKEVIWQKRNKSMKLEVINSDQRKRSETRGKLMGECFYFAINKVVWASRGRSELLAISDWCDGYDQFLFARLERAFYLNNFIWDVLCEGMDKNQITEFAKDLQPPKSGSVRVHNEKITWNVVSPKLEAADASAEAALFKNQILGGAGFPGHWFAEGDKTTRACYSEDTETLTENGWKKYWEIEKNEKIATFNPKKDRIEFHFPKKFYLYDYKGEMYHFTNTRTDILVTPEHKMWVREAHLKKWQIIKAEDIKYKNFYVRDGVKNWIGKKEQYFKLPYIAYEEQSRKKDSPRTFKMNDWLEFLGWYISEGYSGKTKNNYPIRIAQKNEKNIKIIRKMLKKLNFTFKEGDNGKGVTVFSFHNKSLWYYLKENIGCVSGEKRIPKWILQLDRQYLKSLFDSMIKGDGRWDKRTGRSSFTYLTKSKQLTDDFQVICLLLGYSSRVSIGKKDEFRWFIINGSKTIERNLRMNPQTARGKVYEPNIQKKNYDGKVYCFELPNHLFITRRNNRISIQSNTASEMALPTLTKLKSRQKYVKNMIIHIFNFVLDQAIIAGMLDEKVDRTFIVKPSAIVTKDARGLAITAEKFANAMQTAKTNNWITDESAKAAFHIFISQLGIELKELEKVQKEEDVIKPGGNDDDKKE